MILPVYLESLGSFLVVGLFFSISFPLSILVMLYLGWRGSRFAVRNILVLLTLSPAISLLVMSFSTSSSLFLLAGSIGMSSWVAGGGSGIGPAPYNTQLSVLLSEKTQPEHRTLALSLSSIWGSLAFVGGSYFLAALNIGTSHFRLVPFSISGASFTSPTTLFILAVVIQVIAALILLPVAAAKRRKVEGPSTIDEGESMSQPRSASQVFRSAYLFVIAEAFNGLGGGLYLQLIPLWLSHRFGASVSGIGQILAALGVVGIFMVILAPKIERMIGGQKSIVLIRGSYAIILGAMGFAPNLPAGVAFYYTSNVLLRISSPIQLSYVFSKLRQEDWTRASNVISVSYMIGNSIGPLIGAFLLLDVDPSLPLIFASPLILFSAVLYSGRFSPRGG